MTAAVLLAVIERGAVLGHGAITIPAPRNAIDSNELPWSGKIPYPVPFEVSVACLGRLSSRKKKLRAGIE